MSPLTSSFDTHFFRTSVGALAYTDVGTGAPVVCLHGNPTSAHLYRHLIADLASDYRCIAPDYLGFGRSDAPPTFSYQPSAHATLVETWLQRLDLTNLTLVLHDWGGPIGMSYALRHPTTVRRLVLLNTWAWPLDHRPLIRGISRLIDTTPGRLSFERLNAFARLGMPLTTGASSPLFPAWLRGYAAALDTRQRRYACWMFARSLHREAAWLRALWTRRHRLQGRPCLLCWGLSDPAFGSESTLQRWHALFPSADVHRFWNVGHYVPEELGPALSPLVQRFFQSTS